MANSALSCYARMRWFQNIQKMIIEIYMEQNCLIISPCLKGNMACSNAPNLFEIDWLFHHGWRKFWNRCCSNASNRFKLFDHFTIVDGNFEIRPAQMIQITSNCLIISPWLMEILKYDLLKCSKSLQNCMILHWCSRLYAFLSTGNFILSLSFFKI